MFCAKNEKHSLGATLWFNIAHYAVRPWPWILTALVAVALYPTQTDPEVGYIRVMIDHMPPYLRGLMLAGFAAAYMSTMATHLNLGASYTINDFYRRDSVANRDGRGDAAGIGGVAVHGNYRGRMEVPDLHWSRCRAGLHAALVLVAGECVVGDKRHDGGGSVVIVLAIAHGRGNRGRAARH
jgi:hypothetical protein